MIFYGDGRSYGESHFQTISRQIENAKRAIYRQAYIECCAEVGVPSEPIPEVLREIPKPSFLYMTGV